MPLPEFWPGNFIWSILLLALAVGWTIFLFRRKRTFEPGPRKGEAADPGLVRRQNPPDPPSA